MKDHAFVGHDDDDEPDSFTTPATTTVCNQFFFCSAKKKQNFMTMMENDRGFGFLKFKNNDVINLNFFSKSTIIVDFFFCF